MEQEITLTQENTKLIEGHLLGLKTHSLNFLAKSFNLNNKQQVYPYIREYARKQFERHGTLIH